MEFDTDKNKIVLGLPHIDIDGDFFNSILSVVASHILYGWSSIGYTLLPEARNAAISLAYKTQPDFTHFLFIDSDMGAFGPQHVVKLVNNDLNIVSALVCQRKPPFSLVLDFEDNSPEVILNNIKNKRIVKTHTIGMAFTCLKREVLDKTREETDAGPMWFNCDREPRDSFEEEKDKFIQQSIFNAGGDDLASVGVLSEAIAFGQTSHIGSKSLSEDISFSRKCKKLGIDLHIDCGVSVTHVGDKGYNFTDSFTYKEPQLKLVEA